MDFRHGSDMREEVESQFRPQNKPEEALTLSAWLSERGLSQFESVLTDIGVEGVDDLELVEREDLADLGFSIQQMAVFFGESPQPPSVSARLSASVRLALSFPVIVGNNQIKVGIGQRYGEGYG